MDNIYIVIYGEEYEDKHIYADLEKAKHKLHKQHKHKERYFTPFIEIYTLYNGIYNKQKYEYFIEDKNNEIITRYL